jgi:hypothetical protein
MERRPQRHTDLPALPVFRSCYPNRRLPFTPFPTISLMIVRDSLAASLGGKAVSAMLLTSFVTSWSIFFRAQSVRA